MYCAVTRLFNTVLVPSVIVTESLVQVTVVAGPPMEIKVRIFIDNDTPPGMVISPSIKMSVDGDNFAVIMYIYLHWVDTVLYRLSLLLWC